MRAKTPYKDQHVTNTKQVNVRLSTSERDYVKAVSAEQNMTLRELLLDAVNRHAKVPR